MLKEYKTVLEGGTGEITEKKSRFIATVCPVASEEEALDFLERTRKKYWDARHNCYAYTAGMNREFTRAGDDGEPQGTAGRPMLDVLLGEELYNTAVVVTRYFGGILLGTGGLVRAYSKAVKEGLAASKVIEKKQGVLLGITTDYTSLGKMQYIAGENHLQILDTLYSDHVEIQLLVPADEEKRIRNVITEGSSGRSEINKIKELYFAVMDGKPLLF